MRFTAPVDQMRLSFHALSTAEKCCVARAAKDCAWRAIHRPRAIFRRICGHRRRTSAWAATRVSGSRSMMRNRPKRRPGANSDLCPEEGLAVPQPQPNRNTESSAGGASGVGTEYITEAGSGHLPVMPSAARHELRQSASHYSLGKCTLGNGPIECARVLWSRADYAGTRWRVRPARCEPWSCPCCEGPQLRATGARTGQGSSPSGR